MINENYGFHSLYLLLFCYVFPTTHYQHVALLEENSMSNSSFATTIQVRISMLSIINIFNGSRYINFALIIAIVIWYSILDQ